MLVVCLNNKHSSGSCLKSASLGLVQSIFYIIAARIMTATSAPQDLCLDIPDAARLLSLFLGRAIVDEIVPPVFLSAVLAALENDSLGVLVVQACGELTAQICGSLS